MRPRIRGSILLTAVLLAVSSATAPSQTNKALPEPPPGWVGDHCTWFPDGDYEDCCDAHDRDYYRGGTKEERLASDKRLRECVRGKGHKYISKFMYLGVRVGGMAWLKAPFSWGFGKRIKDKEKKVD